MRKNVFLALCIGTLLLFTSCEKDKQTAEVINLENFNNIEIEYDTGVVKREDINQTIKDASLFVFPGKSWDIKFDKNMIIKEVHAEYRKPIEKGNLVLELDTGIIDQEIQHGEFDIEMEITAYDQLKKSGATQSELRLKELDIKILEENLEELKRERESYKIYAPSRVYISKGSLVKGRKIPAGESVVLLSDLAKFEIRTHEPVKMEMFDNVTLGDRVLLDDGERVVEGEVAYMVFNEMDVGHVYFKINEEVYFDKSITNGISLWGKFPDIEVKDILTVPFGAVKYNHKYYVEVIKDGIRRMRFIKFGAYGLDEENHKVVQITSGVSEGETVVIRVKRDANEE